MVQGDKTPKERQMTREERELNYELKREAERNNYEYAMATECEQVRDTLADYSIDSCWEEQYSIVTMCNEYDVSLADLNLDLYTSADEVIEALDWSR